MKIINSLIFLLLCQFIFIFSGGILFKILESVWPTINENTIYLVTFLFSALCLFLCLRAFFPEILLRITNLFKVKKNTIYLFLVIFFLTGLLYIVILITGIKLECVGLKNPIEDTGAENLILLSIAAIICSAIEELFFRGAVLSFFLRRLKPWVSIIIISIFFSLGHMHYTGVSRYINAFIIGILCSILVIKTNTLFLAIGMHGGWNLSYSISNLYFDVNIKAIPIIGNVFDLLKMGGLMIMLILILSYFRMQLMSQASGEATQGSG